jgi:hypothetical protein
MSEPGGFDELPELMRSLRSVGSRRGPPNDNAAASDEQDRFFASLLEARKAAALAISRSQIVGAFEARRLTAAISATVRGYAADRFGARASARRAFEAELFEIIEPLRDALQELGTLADPVRSSPSTIVADAQWDPWLAQLRVVFHLADSSWPALRQALATSPRPSATSGRWRLKSPEKSEGEGKPR